VVLHFTEAIMVRSGTRLSIAALIVIVGIVVISGCQLRVIHTSPYDGTTVEDTSLLAVVSPGGAESYSPEDLIDIEWSGSIASPQVAIELYRYGRFVMVIAEETPNTGWTSWMIPSDFDAVVEVTDDYQIAVRAQDPNHYPGELFVQALSEPFSIVPRASGGLSDVTVSQRIIMITVTDNGQEIDGDTVDIILNGITVSAGHVLAGPPGTQMELILQAGLNLLEVVALNEGSISPNTAELIISNVVEGESVQEWRLLTGETGSLTITAP
jgi:archaellum component FlaF (FlaF/FlaG flagellin family)